MANEAFGESMEFRKPVSLNIDETVIGEGTDKLTSSVKTMMDSVSSALTAIAAHSSQFQNIADTLERMNKAGLSMVASDGMVQPAGVVNMAGAPTSATDPAIAQATHRMAHSAGSTSARVHEAAEMVNKTSDVPGQSQYVQRMVSAGFLAEKTGDAGEKYYEWTDKSPNAGVFSFSDRESLNRAAVAHAFKTQGSGAQMDRLVSMAERFGLGDALKNGKLDMTKNAPQMAEGIAGLLGQAGINIAPETIGSFVGVAGGAATGIGAATALYSVIRQVVRELDSKRKVGLQVGEVGADAIAAGYEQDIQARVMAISPFVTDEQAREIVKGAYGAGFKGSRAETVMQFAFDNFKEFNLHIGESIDLYDEAIARNGETMEGITKTLRELQGVTKESTQSLDGVIQSFLDMSAAAGKAGAVGENASEFSKTVTGAFSTARLSKGMRSSLSNLGTASAPSSLLRAVAGQLGELPVELMNEKEGGAKFIEGAKKLWLSVLPELGSVHSREQLVQLAEEDPMFITKADGLMRRFGLSPADTGDIINYLWNIIGNDSSSAEAGISTMERNAEAEKKRLGSKFTSTLGDRAKALFDFGVGQPIGVGIDSLTNTVASLGYGIGSMINPKTGKAWSQGAYTFGRQLGVENAIESVIALEHGRGDITNQEKEELEKRLRGYLSKRASEGALSAQLAAEGSKQANKIIIELRGDAKKMITATVNEANNESDVAKSKTNWATATAGER